MASAVSRRCQNVQGISYKWPQLLFHTSRWFQINGGTHLKKLSNEVFSRKVRSRPTRKASPATSCTTQKALHRHRKGHCIYYVITAIRVNCRRDDQYGSQFTEVFSQIASHRAVSRKLNAPPPNSVYICWTYCPSPSRISPTPAPVAYKIDDSALITSDWTHDAG